MNLEDLKMTPSNPKKSAIIVAVCLAVPVGAFLAGRYTGPTKTITKTETQVVEKEVVKTEVQYVERKVYVKDVARDVHRQTVVVKKPDGTVTTTTTYDDKTKIDSASSQQVGETQKTQESLQVQETQKTEKVVESARPDWHLAARVGAGLQLPRQLQLDVGVSAERRILGPFWMGLWAQMPLSIAPVTPQGFSAGLSLGFEL